MEEMSTWKNNFNFVWPLGQKFVKIVLVFWIIWKQEKLFRDLLNFRTRTSREMDKTLKNQRLKTLWCSCRAFDRFLTYGNLVNLKWNIYMINNYRLEFFQKHSSTLFLNQSNSENTNGKPSYQGRYHPRFWQD